MKPIGYTLVALFGIAAGMYAANLPKTGVAGSPHDVSGSGCKSCHAPHNGSLANGGTQGTGAILLWSRSFPATANTFGVYDSNTMNNKATELGGSDLTTSTDVRMYSLLCLSCHDGVTSDFSSINSGAGMANANKVGSKAPSYDSAGLTNDHPVNISHNPANDAGLQTVASVITSLPLYGASNTVQCSSCHDSHNNTNGNFLRVTNNTTLCTTCHL